MVLSPRTCLICLAPIASKLPNWSLTVYASLKSSCARNNKSPEHATRDTGLWVNTSGLFSYSSLLRGIRLGLLGRLVFSQEFRMPAKIPQSHLELFDLDRRSERPASEGPGRLHASKLRDYVYLRALNLQRLPESFFDCDRRSAFAEVNLQLPF